MTDGTEPTSALSYRVQVHLTDLSTRIRETARRTHRFSWYCWGFLFALFFGEGLWIVLGLLFPVVTTTVSPGGSISTDYSSPYWAFPIAFAPCVVLLGLALRELWAGRRSTREGSSAHPAGEPTGDAGWTETVRESQQLLTQAKNEAEFSFVPLVFGLFGVFELVAIALTEILDPTVGYPFFTLAPFVAVPFLLLLFPLYRVAQRWVGYFQGLLETEAKGLTQLESDFYWRFAGAPRPG